MKEIVGSLTSPFTRVVRVTCEELNEKVTFTETPPFNKLTEEQDRMIDSLNPLMRVPILIDGEKTIIDSRVIVRYLIDINNTNCDFSKLSSKTLDYQNLLSAIYGMMDAGILQFILQSTHPEIKNNSGYMLRTKRRIDNSLSWLNQVNYNHNLSFSEALLICGLDWMEKRKIANWRKFDNLNALHTHFIELPSFNNTAIPESY